MISRLRTSIYLLIIVGVSTLAQVGCKNTGEIDYCEMLARDQSYVNSDTSDMEKFNADRMKRKELIKNNFRELMAYADKNRFPEMGRLDVSGLDSCRNRAVFITCFHIGQMEPQLFFEDETVAIITREIKKGHLVGSSLVSSLREGFRNHDFCESERGGMYEALKTWQIPVAELPEIRFRKCVE